MLKIGDFSKLSRISIKMLRHYDELELLIPKEIDSATGYRYYGEEQLLVAGRILSLKNMGFGLSDIGTLIRRYHEPERLAEFLEMKRTEILAEEEEVKRRLLLLDTAIKRLREDKTAMYYNVCIKTFPEREVASVRQVIPAYDQEGMLWQLLMSETAPLKMQIADNASGISIFHDDGYKECDVDVEIQLPVKGNYSNTEHVVFKVEPAMEIATATCQGSYDQLTEVNHAVANWIKDNGYEFGGKMFCIYHVGPKDTKKEEDYVTEVCYSYTIPGKAISDKA